MDIRKHFDTKLLIFLTALALLVAVVTGQVQSVVGWKALILSIALVGGIFYIIAHIMINIVGSSLDEKISNKLNESKDNLDKSIADNQCNADNFINTLIKIYNIGTIPEWILTNDELLKFETEYAESEVWIVTSDLLEDGIDGPFFNAVKTNLEKGVIYRYFLPKNDVVRLETDRMKNEIGDELKDKIVPYFLKDDFFFLFSKFDFGIINPHACCGKRYGFMGINTPDGNNNRFQIRIPDNLMNEFVAKLEDKKRNYKQ